MQFLLPSAVLMLMLSVGMSLRPRALLASMRALTWGAWARLLAATFLVPPTLALVLGHLLPIELAATAGLFLIGVAPGAPLMTRNATLRGFNMTTAATYQVWGALLIPLMTPPIVAAAGKLYVREIWIPPLALITLIAKQQFLPLVGGLLLVTFLPGFCRKAQRPLNLLGNGILTVAVVALLWKFGPALRDAFPWVFVAAFALAFGCLVATRILVGTQTPGVETLAISNVNRHVGLALLLSTQHFQHSWRALPAIAAYAVAAPVVMILYARFIHRPSAVAAEPGGQLGF